MSYIGNEPFSVAFLTDQFSGNGSTTAFSLSAAPAGTSSILVAISGVVQDPSTYSVVGNTLTFSPAPPTGTGNISVRFLGIPASGVTTTAYRTVTEFTATSGQTTFSVPSYTPGFIDVYRNGVMLGSADYTATNGLTVVLASGATAGDLVEVISFAVSSVLNAIPATPASVNTANLLDGSVTTAKIASAAVDLTTKVTGVLPQANGGTGTTTGFYGFKNRIINGDMAIDQRNAGASVTSDGAFPVDRWYQGVSGGGVISGQRSIISPTGFTNSLGLTVSTADSSIAVADYYYFSQNIEGFNVADLGWGTANAQSVTISFQVRSSITGTYAVAFGNSAFNRLYVATYTVSVANTWETKTVTIAGDTSGTWLTNNGIGLRIYFDLGSGSSYNASSSNAWLGTGIGIRLSSTANWISNAGATFYITGVQLEKGSTATSFDYLPYSTELQLCQRYYEKQYNIDQALGTATQAAMYLTPATGNGAATLYGTAIMFKVTKRAAPTMSGWSYGGTAGQWHSGVLGASETASAIQFSSPCMTSTFPIMTATPGGQNGMYGYWAASAEL